MSLNALPKRESKRRSISRRRLPNNNHNVRPHSAPSKTRCACCKVVWEVGTFRPHQPVEPPHMHHLQLNHQAVTLPRRPIIIHLHIRHLPPIRRCHRPQLPALRRRLRSHHLHSHRLLRRLLRILGVDLLHLCSVDLAIVRHPHLHSKVNKAMTARRSSLIWISSPSWTWISRCRPDTNLPCVAC